MKELLFQTFRHEVTERAPWVPFAGVHAGSLKGYDATEMLTDADKAFESLMEVNRLYRPDGQPVIFDLQIENPSPYGSLYVFIIRSDILITPSIIIIKNISYNFHPFTIIDSLPMKHFFYHSLPLP